MSYQVLARKWRPSQFSEVVGQQHVLKPLEHALLKQRLHHAYLFSGTRGVGKTTIARILAKALNCDTGVTSTPCGQCSACQEIDQGRFVDLLEIDAASRTKVEDTRELLDNVQYRPTRGRYKVYLIDEVHMLSRHSFNALLKTLEEPPEHVKFLLATTDPQKLPVTVLSRCLQFNLKALSKEDIAGQLKHVLQQEGISADPESLSLLARSANGSMRDALSLTDQAIAQGHGEVLLDSVRQMLGNVPTADIAGLLNDVLNNDAVSLMQRVDNMVAVVPDLSSVLVEMQSVLHQLALMQQLPESQQAFDNVDTLQPLLRQMPAELIQVFYRIVLEGRREQPYAVDAKSGLEMTLLRLLAFRPKTVSSKDNSSDESLLSGKPLEKASSDLTASNEQNEMSAPTTSQPPVESGAALDVQHNNEVNESSASFSHNDELVDSYQPHEELGSELSDVDTYRQPPEPEQNEQPLSQTETPVSGLDDLLQMRQDLMQKKKPGEVASKGTSEASSHQESTAQPRAAAATPESKWELNRVETSERPHDNAARSDTPQPVVTAEHNYDYPEITDDIKEAADIDSWSAMIAGMDISGLARQVLLNSELRQSSDDNWTILVNSDQQSLLNSATEQAVRESLLEVLGQHTTVSFSIGTPTQPTPLMLQQRINEYRHKRALERLEKDNGVMELKKRFGAQIDKESVQAL
ncbi:DNA polymerase III subunit gamma/tau [Idiomarina piscisalsi]|uniref:DNA polymerase III subunit gamma/tau n=1 Tax=Idiomarina piscisalsi TaxID=1096243 RepID=A0ABN5AP32_9GAMM|nr:DNA polymerase III subunit gamma/tau [Idiomarina piscisalsi]ASG65334.1 DNA polymerase III subunit gamma/tau [Idiomarina piscisalsi]